MTSNRFLDANGWPRRLSSAERRRLDAEALERPNDRPNEPPTAGRFDRCTESAYQTHRFGFGGTCEFCGRYWRDCERPPR